MLVNNLNLFIQKKQTTYLIPYNLINTIDGLYNITAINTYNLTNLNIQHKYVSHNNQFFFLKTIDLIKPIVIYEISWSAGMIANLLFNTKNVYKKKTLTQQNARRDWSLWKYIITLWNYNNVYFLIKLSPFSIRIRRFLKFLTNKPMFISINYCWESYKTPKRSIKRWLKKKYTHQSWR